MLISSIVTHAAQSNPEWTAENDVGDFPPIGLMYIAGYLRKHTPVHNVKILDANLLRYTQEEIKREIIDFEPEIVGMTLYTDILYDSLETLRMVKTISPKIRIAVGGAHAINHPEETMAVPVIDYLCIGEGEVVFARLIDALEGKDDFNRIEGLVYRDSSGKVIRNSGAGYNPDLDALPHPAFELLPFKKYYSMVGTGKTTGVICSSRGCPYHCTYCSKLYNNYRKRSVKSIIEEMSLYYKQGVREFMFFDDMFNLPDRRAVDIAKEIEKSFPDIEWSFRGRADQITEELGIALQRSNCKMVTLGAEAHRNDIQKELRTGKTIEAISKAVTILRRHRIRVNTNWIIGLPQHHSAKDIDDLMKVIFQIDPDYVQFSILMLWDDTELYRQAVSKGIVDPELWAAFIREPKPDFIIPCWEEHLPLHEQSRLLRECYRRFYIRPKIVLRQIADIRTKEMLFIKIKGFMLMIIPLLYPLLSLFRLNLSRRKSFNLR